MAKPHQLVAGDLVRIVTTQGNKEVSVATVPSSNTFTVKNWTGDTKNYLCMANR